MKTKRIGKAMRVPAAPLRALRRSGRRSGIWRGLVRAWTHLTGDDGCSVRVRVTRDRGTNVSTLRCRARGCPGRELWNLVSLFAGLGAGIAVCRRAVGAGRSASR